MYVTGTLEQQLPRVLAFCRVLWGDLFGSQIDGAWMVEVNAAVEDLFTQLMLRQSESSGLQCLVDLERAPLETLSTSLQELIRRLRSQALREKAVSELAKRLHEGAHSDPYCQVFVLTLLKRLREPHTRHGDAAAGAGVSSSWVDWVQSMAADVCRATYSDKTTVQLMIQVYHQAGSVLGPVGARQAALLASKLKAEGAARLPELRKQASNQGARGRLTGSLGTLETLFSPILAAAVVFGGSWCCYKQLPIYGRLSALLKASAKSLQQ